MLCPSTVEQTQVVDSLQDIDKRCCSGELLWPLELVYCFNIWNEDFQRSLQASFTI